MRAIRFSKSSPVFSGQKKPAIKYLADTQNTIFNDHVKAKIALFFAIFFSPTDHQPVN
jgi:hypothetical protein